MKLSSKKKFFFSSVFVTFIISAIIFLYTIKNNIRLFNNNFLNNYNNLLQEHLKRINSQNYLNFIKHENQLNNENSSFNNTEIQRLFRRKLIPFKINFFNETFNTKKVNTNANPLFYFEKIKDQNENKYDSSINIRINNEKDSKKSLFNVVNLIQEVSGIYKIHKNYTNNFTDVDLNYSSENSELNKKITNNSNPTSILFGNLNSKGSFEILDQNLFIFKHINFLYLAEKDSSAEIIKENKNKILNTVKELNEKLFTEHNKKINFYIKIVYVNNLSSSSMHEYPDLFADLNKFNSKYTLDELYDEKYLNILISDSKQLEKTMKKVEVLYNKDIKNYIFCLDFDSIFVNSNNSESGLNRRKKTAVDLFNFLIFLKTSNEDSIIKQVVNEYDFEALAQIVKLANTDEIKFYKMIGKFLFDLEKLNKFIANYESSRNIEMIKQKVF